LSEPVPTTPRQLQAHLVLVLIWGAVFFALAWFWLDDLQQAYGWYVDRWFLTLPRPVIWFVRYCHFLFYAFYVAVAVLGWRLSERRFLQAGLIYLVAQLLIAFLLVKLLKMALGRPRPFLDYLDPAPWQPWTWNSQFEAIPSGHSADAAVGLAVLLRFFADRRLRLAGLGLAILVGLGRVIQGQHYFSDIIAGAVIGYLGTSLLAWWWIKRAKIG
jgi:undecaprenyl-diphosphatase